MKLKSVILVDNSECCNIADLCVLLKNSTRQLLEQHKLFHSDTDIEINEYKSESISKQNISDKMALVNSNSFLCFWYGHGGRDCFNIGNESIVTTTENYYVFSNALIYSFSCFNGNELADTLIKNKTKAFVGYLGYAHCPYGIDDIITEIVMSFVLSFLKGKTVNDAKRALEEAYTRAIHNKSIEPLQRLLFQENRDNLIVKGDGNFCLSDILIENTVADNS